MRTYRVEIKLTSEQQALYKKTISACRVVYNLYVEHINDCFCRNIKVMNKYSFQKWFNNDYIPKHPEKKWLKEVSSKAIMNSISNCYTTLTRYHKGLGGKPKFKKVSLSTTGIYFVRAGAKYVIKHNRYQIKVPTLGIVTLKEFGYIPKGSIIINGHIKRQADRYFLSVLTEDSSIQDERNGKEGIGIDLGIKEFMVLSTGETHPNINKSKKIKKLEKSLGRQQRALSRKLEVNKKQKSRVSNNYLKNQLRVQRLYYRLECARKSYINQCIDKVIQLRPNYITLEELNIRGMLKNRHLSKAIKDSLLYYTKQKLLEKATKHNIEVREVNRFYPSSKTCHSCGFIKKDLTLKDRTYKCPSCGATIDRDLNAALNLRDAKEYKVLNITTAGLVGSNACGLCKNLLLGSTVGTTESTQVEARKSRINSEVDCSYEKEYDIA